MKKILLVTDVWKNVNGIVTSLKQLKEGLIGRGYEVKIVHPGEFKNIPLPTYPEIKLALASRKKMETIIKKFAPDFIHIVTEGPLGLSARLACSKNKWKFTSQYHSQLPEYVEIRTGMFKNMTYRYLRWFHQGSEKTMVSAPLLQRILKKKKFKNIILVPVGVDIKRFQKNPKAKTPENLKKPIFTFLGRVAPEKNIEAFLKCKLPGSKLIIGDGPSRKSLEKKYKNSATFVGCKTNKELINLLSISDVFVFPSKTDTFGIAMLEAMACELPVAAFKVPGPKDIVSDGVDGFIGPNLEENALHCLKLDKKLCRKKALEYSADKWCESFLKNISHV